ncbi:hypothetical protein M404DRAFT_584640 [Pisolithus tinctorius Marx 270]|uniref:Uncharacterized protein n=1 Tax=Pisolithus tinctorius Marx 270 TaxID=870435 RepID=A0A0C3PW71_PISTI|nr:hypothetical protein M404DRAFT_584640 [Pisolithus tinctorius Marx 270]
MQSEMFWNVADDDTLHHQVLAPSQSIASIEQRFHSPQLGGTGDYEKLDTAIGTDANFPPCYSAPTRQGYLKAVQDLETDGHNVPQETVASFDLVPAEGVLQFPMPPVPTAESVTPSAFLGGDVTFQQVPQDGVGDMRSPPSTAKNHSMQLIHTPSGLAVDACPSEQKPAISGISSTSEDLDRSRTDASPADADRLFAHSPVFERPSLPAADGLGQASTKGCSKLSSPHSPDHQHMGDDFHDTHSNTSYTTSTPRGAGILASQESQHIALRSPCSPPCSSSPPAAALPPVSQSVLSRSGSVFRPLLTGRKSLLEASLFGDRISQSAFSARDRSISVSALSHSRAKEARSTSVSQNPLRYRQFSTHPPTPISDDGCSKRPLVNMAAVEESLSSHPRSHSAPPCRGLRPLRLSSNHTTRTFSSATSSSSIASAQSLYYHLQFRLAIILCFRHHVIHYLSITAIPSHHLTDTPALRLFPLTFNRRKTTTSRSVVHPPLLAQPNLVHGVYLTIGRTLVVTPQLTVGLLGVIRHSVFRTFQVRRWRLTVP